MELLDRLRPVSDSINLSLNVSVVGEDDPLDLTSHPPPGEAEDPLSVLRPALSATPLPWLVVKGLLLSFLIVATVLGNVLVLLAPTVEPNLRTATHCFVVNLALADLLLGLSVLPFSAALELLGKRWFFGATFCSVWAACDVLCCTASIISLCVISVDRYIGVTRPLTYSTLVTEGRAVAACVAVWLLSFAISVGPLLGWRQDPPSADPWSCEVNKQPGYVLFSVLWSFYLPTLVIVSVYWRIYKAAVRQTKFLETGIKIVKGLQKTDNGGGEHLTLRAHPGGGSRASSTGGAANGLHTHNNNTKRGSTACHMGSAMQPGGLQGRIIKFRRQKKAAKTLGIVVGVFILCWFPFFFLLPLSALCQGCGIPSPLFDVAFWTGYCNSCLNPIIYACSSRDFKRAFRSLLRCGRSPSRRDPHLTPDTRSLESNLQQDARERRLYRRRSEP